MNATNKVVAAAGIFWVAALGVRSISKSNTASTTPSEIDENDRSLFSLWGSTEKYDGKGEGGEYCYNVNIGGGQVCCDGGYHPINGFKKGSVCYLGKTDYSCKDLHEAVFVGEGDIAMPADMIGKRAFPSIVSGDGFMISANPAKGDVKDPFDYAIKAGKQNGLKTALTGDAIALPEKSFLVSGWDENNEASDHEIEWAGPNTIGLGGESFNAPAVIMKGGGAGLVYLDDLDGILHGAGYKTPIDPDGGDNYETKEVEFCFAFQPAAPGSGSVFRDAEVEDSTVKTELQGKEAAVKDKEVAVKSEEIGDEETVDDSEETVDDGKNDEETGGDEPGKNKEPEDTVAAPAPSSDPGMKGDPHIKRWDGVTYDFQGACDLVMLQNPDFNAGQGLHIHVRTKIEHWWSFIETVVIKIGDDTLEVRGGALERRYWVNGKEGNRFRASRNLPFTIGGFHGRFRAINKILTQYRIFLPNDQVITIKSTKDMLRIDLEDSDDADFEGSLGLMGAYSSGIMYGRDGETVIEDPNEFGQEWQVLSSERTLFHEAEGPQSPQQCTMPSTETVDIHRMLGASISREDAEKACDSIVFADELDNCIDDILATGDIEMASAYA